MNCCLRFLSYKWMLFQYLNSVLKIVTLKPGTCSLLCENYCLCPLKCWPNNWAWWMAWLTFLLQNLSLIRAVFVNVPVSQKFHIEWALLSVSTILVKVVFNHLFLHLTLEMGWLWNSHGTNVINNNWISNGSLIRKQMVINSNSLIR